MLSPGAERLKAYLDARGILLCNDTPDMPSLSTIQCVWTDVTELIDAHALFYCRAFRKRSTYLSPEVYFLLRQTKARKPLPADAARLLAPLSGGAILEPSELKRLTLLDSKAFSRAQQFLLENLYITAYRNGRIINPTWSTFAFSSVETWTDAVGAVPLDEDPRTQLWGILRGSMDEAQFDQFLR